jgi:predicted acylesterase/phospholipase RssA/CRP-like cAMP-binding protein
MPERSTVERLALLASRPLLAGLGPAVLEDIDAALESVHLPGDALVVQRGQTGVPLMIVAQGGVRASFEDADGLRHTLFEYFRGGSVCEALVLSGAPSPFDLYTIRDSNLLCLAPDRFHALAAKHPALAVNCTRVLATRIVKLLSSHEFLATFAQKHDRLPRSIALLSVGADGVVRTRDLLSDALSRCRATARLTNGDAPPAGQNFAGWLERLDARTDLLIFECDLSDPAWLDLCLRQADRILVLLDAEETRRPSRMDWWRDARLGERPAQVELAIVHPAATDLPHGAEAFCMQPGIARMHHVRAGSRPDAGRLARWLLDRPVGLVLGGGGAFGIAHVGVLKALEEANVPVDIVGGTSMGAIFAGGVARGWSADRIMEHVRELFASRWALYDFTIPFTSLLAGKKLDGVLDRLFGDLVIADMWTPFFCVATSMARARAEVHDRGRLRDAIRSSCSIPGLFPPFQSLKDLLVDGGLVDNLPIDAMYERCRGPVIAVDVFPYQRPKPEKTREFSERLVARLVEWLKPRRELGPPLFDILVQATLLGSQRTNEMTRADHPPALYLTPQLDRFRVLGWHAYEDLFKAGYECARQEIEADKLPRTLWEGRVEAAAAQ